MSLQNKLDMEELLYLLEKLEGDLAQNKKSWKNCNHFLRFFKIFNIKFTVIG